MHESDEGEIVASRGRKQWMTPRLCSVLDKTKVSNRDAVHIMMAMADALNVPVDNLVINHTSIYELRKEHREREAENAQTEFYENVI